VAPLSKLIELRGLYQQIRGAKVMLMSCTFHQHVPGMHNRGIKKYFLLDGHRYRCVHHFGKLLYLASSGLRAQGFSPLGFHPQASKLIKQE